MQPSTDTATPPRTAAQTAGAAFRAWWMRNREHYETRRALGEALGKSSAWVSKVFDGEQVSTDSAIAIHILTNGAVPGSALRPDIWRNPEDVPIELRSEPLEVRP